MLKIDGSYGEGGGQIIRTAIAMSAITNQPVRIVNIRKGRSQPGLRPQHVTGVNAAAKICGAKVRYNQLGSTELEFEPGKRMHGKFQFNVGTAGAVTLVLQTLVPVAAFGKDCSTFEIIGGTDVKFAPTIDYFMHVFSRNMKIIGLNISTDEVRRGFFPKGGGKVRIVVHPWKTKKKFDAVSQKKLEHIDVHSICSESLRKNDVGERQLGGFKSTFLPNHQKLILEEKVIYAPSLSSGTSIHAHAHFKNCKLGVVELGEKRVPAEDVGTECAHKLLTEIGSGATVDHRMADQILIFLAFGKGGRFKTSRISEHLRTNAWVIQQFLPKVSIKINDQTKIVEVKN
ncbi:RNA 3'-terminal phosphate cyclase [Candidatus Woesearchaeota archaeon]|jgi:RNA 3'-terminal phosphate cyclase (GTP)|nr:RNA 3'-terminal phosphate cyclase [Candidatus Woesearchaeota archaeon]MBT4114168.1 RNA 3'-terminal phosphate cyclase [Candidatus Woesearchaeota archaeon]MBT4248389.1 RNA 3'-terminal phosphate cyclase [Candidatus Woesearchaeota archaeon]